MSGWTLQPHAGFSIGRLPRCLPSPIDVAADKLHGRDDTGLARNPPQSAPHVPENPKIRSISRGYRSIPVSERPVRPDIDRELEAIVEPSQLNPPGKLEPLVATRASTAP